MSLINVIPIGKRNRETRETLMYKAKINNVEDFKKELAKVKQEYIVVFDGGYYLPASKEEYMEFINKINKQITDMQKIVSIANKEMEECR